MEGSPDRPRVLLSNQQHLDCITQRTLQQQPPHGAWKPDNVAKPHQWFYSADLCSCIIALELWQPMGLFKLFSNEISASTHPIDPKQLRKGCWSRASQLCPVCYLPVDLRCEWCPGVWVQAKSTWIWIVQMLLSWHWSTCFGLRVWRRVSNDMSQAPISKLSFCREMRCGIKRIALIIIVHIHFHVKVIIIF